jgi:hypothetical protein
MTTRSARGHGAHEARDEFGDLMRVGVARIGAYHTRTTVLVLSRLGCDRVAVK